MEIGANMNFDVNSHFGHPGNSGNTIVSQDHQQPQELQELGQLAPVGSEGMVDQSFEMVLDGSREGVGEEGGDVRQLDPHIGMEFDSLESGKSFYYDYAERTGFRARAGKCRTSLRDDSVIMKQYTCHKEGYTVKKQRHGDDKKERRNRKSIREGCKAMIQLSRKESGIWFISKFVPEHTHALVGEVKVQKIKKRRPLPVIPDEIKSLFADLSREKDEGVRRDLILGGGESFGLLEYLKMQQIKNPAFFYSVQVDPYDRLTNIFWASARARVAYSYFGDVILFDTSYKKNKNMMPFAAFTGYNHHLQPVVFGCALLVNDSEDSISWLFDTFLVAMCGHYPTSLVTDHSSILGAAAAKVLPNTRHRYCKWQILSKCKEKLPDICMTQPARSTFKRELKKCIDETETPEEFETCWEAILVKYKLRENAWMQSLYKVRQQWAKVYLKNAFFAELSPAQRSESMNKFFQRHFEKKASLREFIMKFDEAMAGQYEKEIKADFASMYTLPFLKTGLPMERQAAETYTKTIFTIFQEEYVQSFAYLAEKFEDGEICKYSVALKGGDAHQSYSVTYNTNDMRASCSCGVFTYSGVSCRHVLRVLSVLGFSKLPDHYYLKRWKQIAKSGPVLYKSSMEFQHGHTNLTLWCNDLCVDVLKYAEEGSTSAVIYKVAKDALGKAFAEVAAARKAVCSAEPGK